MRNRNYVQSTLKDMTNSFRVSLDYLIRQFRKRIDALLERWGTGSFSKRIIMKLFEDKGLVKFCEGLYWPNFDSNDPLNKVLNEDSSSTVIVEGSEITPGTLLYDHIAYFGDRDDPVKYREIIQNFQDAISKVDDILEEYKVIVLSHMEKNTDKIQYINELFQKAKELGFEAERAFYPSKHRDDEAIRAIRDMSVKSQVVLRCLNRKLYKKAEDLDCWWRKSDRDRTCLADLVLKKGSLRIGKDTVWPMRPDDKNFSFLWGYLDRSSSHTKYRYSVFEFYPIPEYDGDPETIYDAIKDMEKAIRLAEDILSDHEKMRWKY